MKALSMPLLLAVAMATASPTARAQSRGTEYPGAAFLYSMDEVTVVYPAGPGEDVERNRRSAELRADYLERIHDVEARAAADDELDGDDLEGNLLLLGWGNRLLGTERAPRPFERTPRGFRFLGLETDDPDADLLLFSRSPYDAGHFVLFWSRIDPELDRFRILPKIGSDWAFVRDFVPLAQGMFRPGTEWPPELDTETTRRHSVDLARIRERWVTSETEHYVVHYDPAKLDRDGARAVAAARERALAMAAAVLDVDPGKDRIALFVYPDADVKNAATGVPDAAHSLPRRREIHMLPRYARSPSPHEEIHVLAREALGKCYLTTIYEGLALSEDETFEGLPVDLHAARLAKTGNFPDLEHLLDENTARLLPDGVRFPAAGMLMRWVRETAADRLASVYSVEPGTVAALADALGRPAGRVETEFRSWLDGRSAPHQDDLEIMRLEAEARDRLLAADYAAVAETTRKMLALRPGDPQIRFNLGSALMRTGDLDEAAAVFLEILDDDGGSESSRFVIFSHYQLGRISDIQGRREDALERYRRMLELPDQHDAHRLAREAMERPATADDLE